jgi:tetratricopeptide (TPR) repeat protein
LREVGVRWKQRADVSTQLALAQLFLVTRDYHESLMAHDRAVSLGGSPRVLAQSFELAVRLGWDHDAREILARGRSLLPSWPFWHAAGLSLHGRYQDHDAALEHGERLLSLTPGNPTVLLEMANQLAAQGSCEDAQRCIEQALRGSPPTPARLESVRLLRATGCLPRSIELLQSITATTDAPAMARCLEAEWCLWNDDLPGAEALAARLLEETPAEAHRILGVIAWRSGEPARAQHHLELARRSPEEIEARLWLAEMALHRGLHGEAHRALDEAARISREPSLAAQLLRLWAALEERPVSLLDRSQWAHLIPPLRLLLSHGITPLETGDSEAWKQGIRAALACMGANRSTPTTRREADVLTALPAHQEPRSASRRALDRIRIAPVAQVQGELEALARAFPESSLPDAHRGELFLWVGRVPEARQALARAISRVQGTRWAYIGLTMAAILEGDPSGALGISAEGVRIMNHTEGPAVYVHRGEALRLLGRTEEARVDLERAVGLHPGRIGAWLNLALLPHDPPRTREIDAFLAERAPGLLSDAARALGVPWSAAAPAGLPRSLLEQALRMLQGNRASSSVTYLSPEGTLRSVGHQGAAAIHERDRARLAALAQSGAKP